MQNPTHEYKDPGFFNVSLTVSGEDGTGFEQKIGLVNVLPGQGAPTAAFVAEPLTGNAPLTVHFFDISSGEVANFSWDFGDGGVPSDERNPVHTFDNPGIFEVELTVRNDDGATKAIKEIIVENGDTPTAAFTADRRRTGEEELDELVVNFRDLSSSVGDNIIRMEWDFGDGTKSEDEDPRHTYAVTEEGESFTVSLTIEDEQNRISTVSKQAFISTRSSVLIFGFIEGRVTDCNDASVGIPNAIVSLRGAVNREITTDDNGEYIFFNIDPGNYTIAVSKNGFKKKATGGFAVLANDTAIQDICLDIGDDNSKRFSFACNRNLKKGLSGIESLVLISGESEGCVLKLTQLEPDTFIEVSTSLRKGLRSSIKIEPTTALTDRNGEVKFTISAVTRGIDLISFAVPNDNGEIEHTKKAYDEGFAWAMFVKAARPTSE